MQAVICCLNSKYIHASLAPWCLQSGVEKYCVDINCKVVESTINRDIEYPYRQILEINPKVIGLCAYIWNIDKTLQLAKLLKERLKDALIVLGGPEVSYRAKSVLKEYDFIDCIVSGEGEKPFAKICNAIKNGITLDGIEGVSFKTDHTIIESQPYITNDEPPLPYTNDFFEQLNGRICYIESSRGCPYSCAFCLSGRCGGVRFFDVEKTKHSIIKLSKSGTKTIKFVDRTFNANLKRAKEIWGFIIENYGKEIDKGVCFHFEIAGDILDSEAIEILSTAPKGLIQLEIGMQSFNPKTLEAINRKTNIERLQDNIRKLVSLRNMHIHIDLIAGLPYENLSSFRESFNIAYSLNADMLQLGFLKLLYGAPMREEPDKYPLSFSKQAPYTVIKTPWLSEEEIKSLQNMEDAFERMYGSGRFKYTLNYLIDQSGNNPFDFFFKLGQELIVPPNISLNDYVEELFIYLKNSLSIKEAVLRDLLVADKLVSDKSGKIPYALKIEDDRLSVARAKVRKEIGNTAAVAIIYTKEAAVCIGQEEVPMVIGVDYNKADQITKRYEIKTFTFGDINC